MIDAIMISVILSNYNGHQLLKQYFILNYCVLMNELPNQVEIIVADDGSTDDSVAYIESLNLLNVRSVINLGSRGFGSNNTFAAQQAIGDYLFFLNNDVQLQSGLFAELLQQLAKPNVFSVVPKIIRPLEKDKNEALTAAELAFWHIRFYHPLQMNAEKMQPILWCCAAACLCKKELFFLLGGFTPAYEPCYTEDADLGMKAWRMGYENWYVPSAKAALHFHSSTIPKFIKPKVLDKIRSRNLYLFLYFHFLTKDSIGFVIKLFVLHALLFHMRELGSMLVAGRRYQSLHLLYRFSGKEVLDQLTKKMRLL